jgi:hypothetical protein
MMEPVILSTVVSAVKVLATECAKGLGSETGKDIWKKIKQLFHWDSDPEPSRLSDEVEKKLVDYPELARQIVLLLQQGNGTDAATRMVGEINAEKVVVAHRIDIKGDLRM